ncbi:M1 family metallopeptidase [Cytophaga aurantiaca]|uniref:M1 family metallopeptidase n=1 Tax=Cytophaga aurantiaca TaxID=29530 RepID=UPI000375A49C|nr:M1 family metallopeptidase [Cytophaga aurantiaca]
MKYLFISFLFILAYTTTAQNNITPSFRSKENPHYWKNKIPRADYWQQDVHYTIDATLDDSLNTITGNSFKLVYWNNSPNDLNELYFHLFQNSAQPGSYYENLNQNNKIPIKYGKYEQEGLGTITENIQVNGQPVKIELDNTILKVFLNKPLLSGDSLVVTMKFTTYYDNGSMRRRMKFYETFNTKHFDGVFWYPSICVYDKKFGWTTDQDLDKEFYHDFGTFDVSLTLPQEYILDATGVMMNEKEVLPDTLRAKLDIKNFANKKFGEQPSIIIPKVKGKTKTWIFHADNVHNFAFTADPLYRIGETSWNGVRVITLAQEQSASKWQQSGEYTARIIKTYSTDFGMYDWPKIIIADAKDGMEYSMLTLDNGTYPQHQYLLSHEVGHMWFYGMVGSNETYRAFMDEGFTQFLTVWSMDKLLGAKRARAHTNKFIEKYLDSAINRNDYLYAPYLNHVTENFDEPLNTHSCAFNGAVRHSGNYGLVYFKAGTMLYNLKYVLGDSLFIGAMKHYVQKWKFAHPYPEDFRDAIIEYTKTDLNWFFDEWLETSKNIDYKVKSVKKISSTNQHFKYELTFERIGRMQMPLKYIVTFEDGTTKKFLIPNTWFVPPTKDSVLTKWYGWDLLQPTYTTVLETDSKIKSVIIDPEMLLADSDNSNNQWGKKTNSTWQFDHRVPQAKSWKYRRNYIRPDIWYNGFDGVQVGVHAEGKYFNKYNYHVSVWGNTTLGQNLRNSTDLNPQYIAFNAIYNRQLSKVSREMYANTQLAYNAGIWKGIVGLEKTFRKQDQSNPRYTKVSVFAKYLVNEYNYQPYLLYPTEWGVRNQSTQWVNASFNISILRKYVYTKGNGTINISIRAPFIASDYNYSQITGEAKNNYALTKKLDLKTRAYAQLGLNDVPLESSLYAAGANQEQLIDNKYTRAIGFIPFDWLNYQNTTNHFQYGGGLNLRGYAGNVCTEKVSSSNGDSIVYAYNGQTGGSVNLELEFDKYIKIKPKGFTKNIHFDMYGFFDAGILNYKVVTKNYWSSFRMDAGLGTAMTIKFTPYDITPLVIRADFPLWINTPTAGENYGDFRWVLSVNRAF